MAASADSKENLGSYSFFMRKWHPATEHNGHKVITHETNFSSEENTKWVSVGPHKSDFREIFFIDEESPFIFDLKLKVEQLCQSGTVYEKLQKVSNLLGRETFEIPNRDVITNIDMPLRILDESIGEEAFKGKGKNLPPRVKIEDVFDNGLAICRHRGAIAAILIGHLIKVGLLPRGTARQYRTKLLTGGGHLWSVYRDFETNDIWMIDPMWNNVFNLKNGEHKIEAIMKYGFTILKPMQQRLDIVDGSVNHSDIKKEKSILETRRDNLAKSEELALKLAREAELERQRIEAARLEAERKSHEEKLLKRELRIRLLQIKRKMHEDEHREYYVSQKNDNVARDEAVARELDRELNEGMHRD